MLTRSESRKRAGSWPYPRHNAFTEALQCAAAAWFRQHGHPVRVKSDYILDHHGNWPRNIILREVASYIEQQHQLRKTAGKGFPLHNYIHHGLSSQAMVFNLVGPLIVRRDYEPLRHVIEAQGLGWPTGTIEGMFECEDRKVFNENRSQPTSIDVVIRGDSGPTVCMEAKLTEAEFGGCSIFINGDCDGRNPVNDLAVCYLHHIGRLYVCFR